MNSKTLTKLAVFASATLLLTSMASCSPKVITDISQQMPATDASEVRVYDEGAIVPNSAQVIGQVRVTDGGFCPTKRCKYPLVLDIAKQETAKAGGNALFVRLHQTPDTKSTCHRITCDMLHLTDTIVDPTQANPLMDKAAAEEKAFFDKMDKDNEIRQLPLNYINISGGLAWLDNKILTERGMESNSPTGFNLTFEYSHLWRLKAAKPCYWGLAFIGVYNTVKYDDFGSYHQSMNLDNYFLGAGCKWAYKTNKSFLWDYTLGLGYGHTKDDMGFNDAGGFGIYCSLGFGYMLGKHFCIGTSLSLLSTYYAKPDGWPKDKRYGIDNGNLNIRLGYFF